MVGMLSDIGNVRAKNEDYVDFYSDEFIHICVIADGMGGYNSGEVASSLAVKEVMEYIKANLNKDKPEVTMKEAIISANAKVYKSAMENEDHKGMGTTLTACIIFNEQLVIGHVGDSSCMAIIENILIKLTKDHSLVQQLLDSGSITEEEAILHPKKNIITRALGTDDFVEIDIQKKSLQGISKIILCTDGLSNVVTKEEIYEIVISNNVEEACSKLINLGKEKGSRDNLSVIVFEGEGK